MTATWTTPATYVDGTLYGASHFNQYVRDNLDYLKARPIQTFADLDGTVTNTTSGTFVDMTGATVSLTTSGSSKILVLGNVVWQASSTATATVTVLIDGVNQGDATRGIMQRASLGASDAADAFVFLTAAAVSNGAHTVKLQYKTSAGTLTVAQVVLVAMEVF